MTAATDTTTVGDAVSFILTSASESDLDRILTAYRQRKDALGSAAAASINVGDQVAMLGLSPKALNGLQGAVESIRGARADVRLTLDSTKRLAQGRTRMAFPANFDLQRGSGYVVTGVPTKCLRPAS